MKVSMKKKPYYYKPIIIGFAAFYLFSMLLSTYFVTEKYKQEYNHSIETVATNMAAQLESFDEVSTKESENTANPLTLLVSTDNVFQQTEKQYQQISVAVYSKEDGRKIAQTDSCFCMLALDSGIEDSRLVYSFEDLLTREELDDLVKHFASYPSSYWSLTAKTIPETYQLCSLKITAIKLIGKEYDEFYERPESSWTWENTVAMKNDNLSSGAVGGTLGKGVIFPYLTSGENQYTKWRNNEYLHDFPNIWHTESEDSKHLFTTNKEYVDYAFSSDYSLRIRSSSQPLLAAMDYLKYVYIIGFLLTSACIVIVTFATNKTYEQRVSLEETRRDFTNAIAHELKTPLGVIRGFAENLKEDTVSEKRDYYLKQIINQTENMNGMVGEMIYISKLDSELLQLQKEMLSMRTLMETQLSKLEPLADEKNLEIYYQTEDDFSFEGDKNYLEKAIWNLLSNAIEYNFLDGRIIISMDTQKCSIENTGKPIDEEDLPHVCDMLYTGDKSRNSQGKHMGLGLYLAKKILELHNLKLTIENTDIGVKVTIF